MSDTARSRKTDKRKSQSRKYNPTDLASVVIGFLHYASAVHSKVVQKRGNHRDKPGGVVFCR